MALPDLTGFNIEDTYQRVLHTDGVSVYDGTGSLANLSYTGSFSGDGSGLTGIIALAAPAGPDTSVQFNDGGVVSGSSDFTFDKALNTATLNGNLRVLVSGSFNIDSFNRNLYDPSYIPSIDWGLRNLLNSQGTASINWASSELLANIEPSINWDLRWLLSSGGVISIDYQNGCGFDYFGAISIIWPTRALLDESGQTSVKWGQSRSLLDLSASESINWKRRQLVATDGITPILSWGNVSGSLIGSSSWAVESVSASFVNGGTF